MTEIELLDKAIGLAERLAELVNRGTYSMPASGAIEKLQDELSNLTKQRDKLIAQTAVEIAFPDTVQGTTVRSLPEVLADLAFDPSFPLLQKPRTSLDVREKARERLPHRRSNEFHVTCIHVTENDIADNPELEPIWTSGDGAVYWCPCQINNKHLANIIKHLGTMPVNLENSEKLSYFLAVAKKRGLGVPK